MSVPTGRRCSHLAARELAGYEEVILMNYTLAGPVCTLEPMLAAMDARLSWISGG